MFDKDRYKTCGISNDIPQIVQEFLWKLIEDLTVEKDYLQVFEIETADEMSIQVTHSQEEPEYQSKCFVNCSPPCPPCKIFVIDDGPHSTMLLAEEY